MSLSGCTTDDELANFLTSNHFGMGMIAMIYKIHKHDGSNINEKLFSEIMKKKNSTGLEKFIHCTQPLRTFLSDEQKNVLDKEIHIPRVIKSYVTPDHETALTNILLRKSEYKRRKFIIKLRKFVTKNKRRKFI